MFKNLLRWIAWRILDKHIRENYIHRAYFGDYTRWMSRDFPIMQDMYEHFKDKPYGSNVPVPRIREEMAKKYFPKAK